jgi:signal transduction histidine kinase
MTDSSVLRPDLSLVLERITDGFFALDADWRITYINGEACKLLHASDDCVGKAWLDAFPKARGRLFEREYARAMRDQQAVQFIEYSKTANCWFEVKAYPSADGLSVFFRDVTSRIESQREVERNARRQQALIDFGRSALAGLTYEELLEDAVDLIREILGVNVVEILDFDRGDLTFTVRRSIGWGSLAIFDPLNPPVKHLLQTVKTGDPFVCADVRIDPRVRSLAVLENAGMLSSIAVLIGTPQMPMGVIAAYYAQTRTFSISDVRFVESIAQTVAESASATESNRRMVQVLDSIKDAFVAVDRDLCVTYVNARMARFWRRQAGDVVGLPISHFTDQFGDGGAALRNFKLALREERALTYETNFNGRWYESRIYPFAGGVAAYVRDITRRKTEQERMVALNVELERRVAERTAQLELANKELESFSYSVSHDLRAPLRAIDGFSQALLEDYGEAFDDRAKGYLDRVRRAAQRMADLIDALLKLAKVARAPLVLRHVDVSAVAAGIVEELQASEPGRTVEVAVEPGLQAVADPNLVGAVLQNLIGNAWKFTRRAEAPRIEIGRNAAGEFFVRDNGAGFDMTYQNKLFGAFQRLHSTDEYEGTGIGLATVARIIHRHGCSIRAEGAVGAGATLYFTLPSNEDRKPDQ